MYFGTMSGLKLLISVIMVLVEPVGSPTINSVDIFWSALDAVYLYMIWRFTWINEWLGDLQPGWVGRCIIPGSPIWITACHRY